MKKHLILAIVVIAGAPVVIAGCTSSSSPSPGPATRPRALAPRAKIPSLSRITPSPVDAHDSERGECDVEELRFGPA
jgi:hypothetical protein